MIIVMKKTILISLAFILISCGPSPEEMATIAQLTCNIMAESRNMDGALRIKEINVAREKLGMPAFLGSDEEIKESFEYGLCTSLVLNNDNDYRDLLQNQINKGAKKAQNRCVNEIAPVIENLEIEVWALEQINPEIDIEIYERLYDTRSRLAAQKRRLQDCKVR
jgi:hypothetical protein